jgi:hypothetical protein
MADQTKKQSWPLQIKNLDPDIILQFKVYAVSNKMSHAEVFTKAFLALLTADGKNDPAAPREKSPDFSLTDGNADFGRGTGQPAAE